MSTEPANAESEFVSVGVDAPDLARYANIDLEDGELLVYDREVEDAWIQSDDYIDLGLML